MPKASSNASKSWEPDENISLDDIDSYRPDFALDSIDFIHIVWSFYNESSGESGIYYRKYNGLEWEERIQIDSWTEATIHPVIAIDQNDHLHVVWEGDGPSPNKNELFYSQFDGNSWSEPVMITLGAGLGGYGPNPGHRIIIDSNNNISVFWTDSTVTDSPDIVYTNFNGSTWSLKQYATNDPRPDYGHFNPDVVIDSNNNIHLVFVTTEPAGGGGYNYILHYKKFDGSEWSEEIRLSDVDTCVNTPSIAIGPEDNVHVIWGDCRNHPGGFRAELYYTKLDDNGNTLINDLRLTYDSPDFNTNLCDIVVDDENNSHILWEHTEAANADNQTIWYAKLDNNGNKIIENTNLTISCTPDAWVLDTVRIALDSKNRIHIVFQDDRTGNLEIYHKRTKSYDLSISPEEIQFSNFLPANGEEIIINATVSNIGEYITNGTVNFYLDSIEPGNLIGYDSFSIGIDETYLANMQWTAITGTHIIWVEIIPEEGIVETNLTNNIANKSITVNDPPTISVTAPPSGLVTVDDSYTISWVGNDPDDDATISLYYDNDNTGNDGTLIDTSDQYPSGIVDNNGVSQGYDWDTTGMTDGTTWYIYAKIDDSIHAPVYSYSQGKIEIDHPNIPPTLEITSPSGGSVSGSVTIQGTAHDPDKGIIESVYVSIDNKASWKLATGTSSWTFEWDTTKYSNGEHIIYAKAYDGEDSSEIVSVTVTVDNGGNIAPQVSITDPKNGVTVSDGVEIRGSASDDDGFVQVVEIQIDNEVWREVIGTSNWNYDWDTTTYTNGEHMINARAKDDLGVYSQEKSITVIVDNGGNIFPNIQITSHSGGEIVSGTLQIKGTAADHDGNVELVEVRIDNSIWYTAMGTASWAYNWDTATYGNGEHVIYARAKDDLGEYSQIRSITLIVDNGGNIPPIIHILSPTGGTISGEVTVSGSVSDLDGDDTIEYVQIKINEGDWENTQGITEWSYTWNTTTLGDGNYTISARAYDGIDYSKVKSVNITVDNPHKPTLTITSEIPDEVSGTITIQGTASDVDGEITKVEIQIDNGEWEEIEGTSDWSYELDTTKLENGEHTIRIRVYDDEGEYHEEAFSITVKNDEDILWVYLIIAIIVICIIVGVAVWKMRAKSGITSKSVQQMDQTQTVRCPQCNNLFEAPQTSETIKCPHCGLSGKSAT
ncbi:MAG: hypothetical protein JSW00_15410 [Thermoplasmata archaeon]|nr:MAG: hypothetical protein JSW00_15410 [Thermoplasmata archaeon]